MDLVISLSVYIRAAAFKSPTPSSTLNDSEQQPKFTFNEGQETLDEQALRERKTSLLKLFDIVGARPRAGADLSKHRGMDDHKLHGEAVKNMTQVNKPKKDIKTEIVGDGEEVEVEEGEDLSENELDMIYKKYALQLARVTLMLIACRAQENDRLMDEMDPPDTFTLTLRGYQKQALL